MPRDRTRQYDRPASGIVACRVYARLRAGRGRVVTWRAVLHAVYGEREDGGPEWAEGVVRIAVYMIRKGLPRGALRSHPGLGFSLDPAAPVLTTLLLDERE